MALRWRYRVSHWLFLVSRLLALASGVLLVASCKVNYWRLWVLFKNRKFYY